MSDNTVDILQSSDNNTIRMNARGTPPAPGGGVSNNSFTATQMGGSGNFADGYMANGSESNVISLIQDGSGNTVDGGVDGYGIYVDGDMNTITISQTGTGHMADVATIGDGNTAVVTQN